MKCNISGPRDMGKECLEIIEQAIKDSGFEITKLMSTCEKGVDTWARNWAAANEVPVSDFKADWKTIKGVPKEHIKKGQYGKYNSHAGKLRDDMMMAECDASIIIDDGGYSKKYLAKQYGVELHIHVLEDNTEYEHQF